MFNWIVLCKLYVVIKYSIFLKFIVNFNFCFFYRLCSFFLVKISLKIMCIDLDVDDRWVLDSDNVYGSEILI